MSSLNCIVPSVLNHPVPMKDPQPHIHPRPSSSFLPTFVADQDSCESQAHSGYQSEDALLPVSARWATNQDSPTTSPPGTDLEYLCSCKSDPSLNPHELPPPPAPNHTFLTKLAVFLQFWGTHCVACKLPRGPAPLCTLDISPPLQSPPVRLIGHLKRHLSDPVLRQWGAVDLGLQMVLHLGAGFFFLYGAANSASGFVPSVIPNHLGDESLMLIQLALTLFVLPAPAIVRWLGEVPSIVLGAAAHILYMAALIRPSKVPVLICSCLAGMGASVLWVAQGIYLSNISPPDKVGQYVGIFYGMYYGASIAGSVVGEVLILYCNLETMFIVFAILECIGTYLLWNLPPVCLLRDPDIRDLRMPTSVADVDEGDPVHCGCLAIDDSTTGDEQAGAGGRMRFGNPGSVPTEVPILMDLFPDAYKPEKAGGGRDGRCGIHVNEYATIEKKDAHLNTEKQSSTEYASDETTPFLGPAPLGGQVSQPLWLLLLLLPLFASAGYFLPFWTGNYTKLVPESAIGVLLFAGGVGQVAGAFGLCCLGDWMGSATPTFLLGIFCAFVGLGTCFPLFEAAQSSLLLGPVCLGAPLMALLGALMFGIADGMWSSHIVVVLVKLFPGDNPIVWSAWTLVFNGAEVCGYLAGIVAPIVGNGANLSQVSSQGVTMMVGTIIFVGAEWWGRRTRAKESKKSTCMLV